MLSIVIPIYNENGYVYDILERVQNVELNGVDKEIVVVDDGSNDGTVRKLEALVTARDNGEETFRRENCSIDLDVPLEIIFKSKNEGKGKTLRRGFSEASGDLIVIQDADLEYDPQEYSNLLKPIREGRADVVYGSRFLGGPHRALYFRHYLGNKLLTTLSNFLTDLNLSDIETCYKMFRASVLDDINLREDRFGFEPEFTAKVAREGYRIYEVPISYYGRTYEEGKKIGWQDGLEALRCIVQYNLTN